RLGKKGLRNEIGGLGAFACQQQLQIGGDKNHRNVEAVQNLGDRIDARSALAEIDICEHEARLLRSGFGNRFVLGGGKAHAFMAQVGDQILEVESNHRLVFDDEDAGSQ